MLVKTLHLVSRSGVRSTGAVFLFSKSLSESTDNKGKTYKNVHGYFGEI